MKLIPDEKRKALELLELKKLDTKPTNSIRLLIKYYYSIGYSKDEVFELMMEFMENVTGSSVAWKSKLKREVSNLKDSKLNCVESIVVTENEMNTILSVKNETLERLMFCLLVTCKVSNAISGKNGEWVYIDSSLHLFKDMMVNRASDKRDFLINELKKRGFINIPRKTQSLSIKLNYIDNKSKTAIKITKFDDYILDYISFKGQRVIECIECGKRIEVKPRVNIKYCNECKTKKDLYADREYQKRRYKNNKII